MNNNIKELIKIPKELDDAVLKGFEKGKKEKKKEKQRLIFKRSTIAAGIIMAGTTMAGIFNPEIVSAIPIIGNIFEYFNDGIYTKNSDKYEELANVINTTVDDNGVKVTLNKVIVDDNIFIASLIVESDKFIGYDEARSPQDFIEPNFNISINGDFPTSLSSNVTIVNQSTAAIILECDISKLNLENKVNIDLDISKFTRGKKTLARGKWNFDVKATKGADSTIHQVNDTLQLNDENINIEKLVSSDLINRIYFSGKCSDYENFSINKDEFIVRDNTGKILLSQLSGGVVSSSNDYEYTFDILNDLSNVDYIEIIKADGNKAIEKDNRYLLKASSIDESIANRSNELISRKPTKEELNDGYGLNEVTYNVNIDKNNAFETINSLIGKEIAVNNTDKIIVKDIIAYDDYTEVVMKIEGNYNYELLSSVVLFDEDMNDSSTFEGASRVLNNIEEKIVTVKLTKIDPNKKYTIAIPTTTDLTIDESKKLTINLK